MIERRQELFDLYKHNYRKSNGKYDMGAITAMWEMWGCELTPEEQAFRNYRNEEIRRRREKAKLNKAKRYYRN